MANLMQTMIENYDVSDLINQTVILILMLLLAVRLPRIRFKRKAFYY